ncbi:MAG TPA: AraC family transcriptional regulator [Clostridia bacterium]|nr:AraC family transcriptional regulator [Clostridia bacterium]
MGAELYMRAMHQKNFLEPDFPFSLAVSNNLEFPPHWHEEVEIVYMVEGDMQIGLNNETFQLQERDIFLIGRGNVHHFTPPIKPNKSIIIQLGLPFFRSLSIIMENNQFLRPLLEFSRVEDSSLQASTHNDIENQILAMIRESKEEKEGYKMALKARLFDLMVILVRQVPMEPFPIRDKHRQVSRLKRLDKVLAYIDSNYHDNITLGDVALVANFSKYHFTRFFKEATGMTFNEYLNMVRVRKVEEYLLNVDIPITEIGYKAGFNSIQTFNRVFKRIKGCSPTEFRKKRLYHYK